MNNKIFNLVAVLNEIFREIDIDFDDHIEVILHCFFHLFLYDSHIDYRQPGRSNTNYPISFYYAF